MHRRQFILSTIGVGANIALPRSVQAQQSGCEILEQLLANSKADEKDPNVWAALHPLFVNNVQLEITKLRARIDNLSGTVDAKQTEAILNAIDAFGTAALVGAGFAIGAMPAFIAGIAFSGTMLIVRGGFSPQKLTSEDILTNVAGSRVPTLLETFGQGAVAISKNAAKYGKIAGHLTDGIFVGYSAYKAFEASQTFDSSSKELQRLKDALAALEADLGALNKSEALQKMRQACARAVIDDLMDIRIKAKCPLSSPPLA